MPQLDTAAIEARLADMEKDLSQCFFCRGNGNGGPECTDYRGDAADVRALLDEMARLRGLVEAALDLAGDMIGYVPEYFQQKHQHQERLAEARKALEAANDRRL